MKLTKVQTIGTQKTTSIPKDVADKMKLEKGDHLKWEVSEDGKTAEIKKLKGE